MGEIKLEERISQTWLKVVSQASNTASTGLPPTEELRTMSEMSPKYWNLWKLDDEPATYLRLEQWGIRILHLWHFAKEFALLSQLLLAQIWVLVSSVFLKALHILKYFEELEEESYKGFRVHKMILHCLWMCYLKQLNRNNSFFNVSQWHALYIYGELMKCYIFQDKHCTVIVKCEP